MPYWTQCSSIVKIRSYLLQVNVQGFNCFSLCVVGLNMLHVAACRSTLCCLVHTRTAMPFFTLCLITSPWCSLSLFSSVLPGSPMWTLSHSAHGTWYTTPFFFHSGWGCFVSTKSFLRASFDLKVVLMPRLLHFLSILSLTPLTYGKWRNLGAVCSCSSVRVKGVEEVLGSF